MSGYSEMKVSPPGEVSAPPYPDHHGVNAGYQTQYGYQSNSNPAYQSNNNTYPDGNNNGAGRESDGRGSGGSKNDDSEEDVPIIPEKYLNVSETFY